MTNFEKYTGTKTELNIISEILVNRGTFSYIYDSTVDIGDHKRRRFVIKRYIENEYLQGTPEERTRIAFENYSWAKNAGLKVFPTFRIGENKRSILMTTGFSDDQICVGSNNSLNVIDLKRPLIKEIENMDEFLPAFFREGLKAAEKEIELYQDAFFFILSRNEPTKIDFVLGDLDNLIKADSTKYTGLQNMRVIKTILLDFCIKNIDPSGTQNFLDKVDYYYKQGVSEVDKRELT